HVGGFVQNRVDIVSHPSSHSEVGCGRIVKAQTQTREVVAIISGKLGSDTPRLGYSWLKGRRSALLEPGNRLAGGCEPRATILQFSNRFAIAFSPESFGG